MSPGARAVILGFALVLACSKNGGSSGIDTSLGGPDGDADTDADADADTDTDTDADADTDTDTEPVSSLDCSADYTAQTPPPGDANGVCITQEIFCGQEILHTNEGGGALYDKAFWEAQQELSSLATESASVLDGPERVYAIKGQSNGEVIIVTIESCADMWGSWRRYADVAYDWCDYDDNFSEAGHFSVGTFRDQTESFVNNTGSDYSYELIVDSYYGGTGNFRLNVDCY